MAEYRNDQLCRLVLVLCSQSGWFVEEQRRPKLPCGSLAP
jgi:hypothetical protein